jgi:hypothetical protein
MAQHAALDGKALKVLQLECIITSKDKEISLLREQLSQDQEVCSDHNTCQSCPLMQLQRCSLGLQLLLQLHLLLLSC